MGTAFVNLQNSAQKDGYMQHNNREFIPSPRFKTEMYC